MATPRLSVITVCHNDAGNLALTLRSVLAQTYANVEYVVVDGGSTDGTLAEIRRHATGITRWISEPDGGIYDAMNKGLRIATGDYVTFMNAGDEFLSRETLAAVADLVERRDSPPLVVYGGAVVLAEDGTEVASLQPLDLTKANLNMFATRTVCHQSIFVARRIAREYDVRFRLKAELDWYYHLVRATRDDERLRLDLMISRYRMGGRGDQQWRRNEMERVRVTRQNNSLLSFVLSSPFFLVPLVFRLKRSVGSAFRRLRAT